MEYYYLITAIVFACLFAIWSKRDWGNTLLKLAFLGLALWGVFNFLVSVGYIVKGL